MISNIFKKILCLHKWEEFNRVTVSDEFGSRWQNIILICKDCGKFKKIKSSNWWW